MASPNRLLSLAKYVEPNRANSLKQYIYNLILTYYFDDKSPLFGLVNGKLDKLFDIADLRNEKGHGQTETSGEVSMITEAAAESCYSFIKEFFNKYQPMIDAVIKRMTGGSETKMKLPYADECPAEMGLDSEPMQTVKRMLPMISAEEWKTWFKKMNEAK